MGENPSPAGLATSSSNQVTNSRVEITYLRVRAASPAAAAAPALVAAGAAAGSLTRLLGWRRRALFPFNTADAAPHAA